MIGRIGILILVITCTSNLYAQFGDPLFGLSVSKSNKLKAEKKVVDSVTIIWDSLLYQMPLSTYQLADETMPVFEDVEQKAEYDGGLFPLIDFINKEKEKSLDSNSTLSGVNIIKFIISDKGDVLLPQVVYSDCEVCKSYSLKVFDKMPRWNPARVYGTPVYSYYSLPIIF